MFISEDRRDFTCVMLSKELLFVKKRVCQSSLDKAAPQETTHFIKIILRTVGGWPVRRTLIRTQIQGGENLE